MTNFDEILNQCSMESRIRYDGNPNELKLQLERTMVNRFHFISNRNEKRILGCGKTSGQCIGYLFKCDDIIETTNNI